MTTSFLLSNMLLLALFGALAPGALGFAAESRPGFDEQPEGKRFGALR